MWVEAYCWLGSHSHALIFLPFMLNQILMLVNNNSALIFLGQEFNWYCLFYAEAWLAQTGPDIFWIFFFFSGNKSFQTPFWSRWVLPAELSQKFKGTFVMLSKISSKWVLAASHAPPVNATQESGGGWRRMAGEAAKKSHLWVCSDGQHNQNWD